MSSDLNRASAPAQSNPIQTPPTYNFDIKPIGPLPPSPALLKKREESQRMLTPKSFGIAVFAFLFSYFYGEAVLSYGTRGVGVTLVILLYCLFSYFVFYHKSQNKQPRALVLYLPIGVISLGFSLHYNPMSHLPMTLTLLVLFGLQLMLFLSPAQTNVFTVGGLKTALARIVQWPLTYLFMPFRALLHKHATDANKKQQSILRKFALIALGLIVALPACALLLVWFTRADAGFSDVWQSISDFFRDWIEPKWDKILLNCLFLFLIGTPLGALLIYNAGIPLEVNTNETQSPRKTVSNLFLSTFLSAVTAVILLFVATQFQYFFFGAEYGTIASIGYAAYARQGFFELTYASAFIFTVIVLVLVFCKRRENGAIPPLLKGLLGIMCVSNIIILISAVQRMLLYVAVHGQSIKRLMTLWFMPILGVCTLLLLVKCFWARFAVLKYTLYTVTLAVCVLSLMNTDRIVAKQRVDLLLERGYVQEDDEIVYFEQLSYACLPEVERFLSQYELRTTRIYSQFTLYRDTQVWIILQTSRSFDSFFAYTLDRQQFSKPKYYPIVLIT